MRDRCSFGALCLTVLLLSLPAFAQDSVTIPKSRLEELERKEAELQRLKGASAPTNNVPVGVRPATAPSPVPAPGPVTAPGSPAPLPAPTVAAPPPRPVPAAPIQPTDTIDAAELAAQYRSNPTAAEARYYKKTFLLRGEIIGFEHPVLTSNYKIVLKTAEPLTRVICDFLPPQEASAVFAVKHGMELVAQVQNQRVHMTKVGDTIVVRGQCRGLQDQVVKILGREFKIEH